MFILRLLSLLPALAGALCVEAAPGEAANRRFDITAQSLGTALTTLADQAGIEILFPEAAVEGRTAPALSGSYTPRQAVESLLAGTGLRYTFTADDSVIVRTAEAKTPPPAPQKPEAPTAKPEEEVVTLPEMTVTAKPTDDTSYNPPNATTATKTDTPIMETPVNIQVVPKQVLRDQQAFQLSKALQNVSGVFSDPILANGGNSESSTIRGFQTDDTYRNGMRMPTSAVAGLVETANAERIEVLKGPAAILYGRIEPGGLINVVTKQPLASPYYALQQLFGSFDLFRTTADATGPITRDDTLLYRLNLAYESADSFQDFRENERIFVAPVLRWNIGPRTQATFELEYQNAQDPAEYGIPIVGNRPAKVPRDFTINEPGNRADTENVLAGFDWSHAFNEHWSLRHDFHWFHSEHRTTTAQPQDVVQADGTVPRLLIVADGESETYTTNLNLIGNFDTWGLRHTLLLGGDYYRFDNGNPQTPTLVGFFLPSFDLTTGVHDATQGALFGQVRFLSEEDWYGFYLQDQVQLPLGFQILAGFRYDHATQQTMQDVFIPGPPPEGFTSEFRADDEAVTPRFGLLWRPIPEVSLYGNYVENFGAPNLASPDAFGGIQAMEPQTAQQWEVGLKTELYDGRLTGTLAWFDLAKQNIPAADPRNPFRTILVGEARNRGLEMDIAGEILPGWRVIAAGAYIDSEITQDSQADFSNVDADGNPLGTTPGNTGHRLSNVPEFSGSVWTTYEWQQGLLKGIKLGGGMVARSQREGDNENTFQLPGYGIVNLMAGYEWKVGPSKVSLQLNVENLVDKDYFVSSLAGARNVGASFGAPRTFLGSVRVEF